MTEVEGDVDFDAMQTRLHPAESRIRKLSAENPARFIAFDVLAWDGSETWRQPFASRCAFLEGVAGSFDLSPSISDPSAVTSWLDELERLWLDGVLAKQLDRPVEPGARGAKTKVKPERTADCVVVGVRWKSKPDRIATLLLGLYREDGESDYVGSAAVVVMQSSQSRYSVARRDSDRRFSEPNRWAEVASRNSLYAPSPSRGALRQGAGQSLRHGTKLLRFRPDKDHRGCGWAELLQSRESE